MEYRIPIMAERKKILNDAMSLADSEITHPEPFMWPSQRRFLKRWLKEFNSVLFRSRKNIGKAITLSIVGTKDKNVLERDSIDGQRLKVEISVLDKSEVNKVIIDKLKGLKK